VGAYVMTQNTMPPISSGHRPDGIATGKWSFDEHMTGKYAVPLGNGSYVTQLEGNFWPQAGPYEVPYSALTPKRGTGANLLVPVCLSASAVAYSSTRIETMFMATGTAAGVAAKQLADGSVDTVQDVNVTLVQDILVTQFNQAVHVDDKPKPPGPPSQPPKPTGPVPKYYDVVGAGEKAWNGRYEQKGTFEGWPQWVQAATAASTHSLYFCEGGWRLAIQGKELFYVAAQEEGGGNGAEGAFSLPPLKGWQVADGGKAPAPSLVAGPNGTASVETGWR
jgi:hypothetical protein